MSERLEVWLEARGGGRWTASERRRRVELSCRDVVDAIKDPRWLGSVVHEPGVPVIASRHEDGRATPGHSSKQEVQVV